MERKPKPLGQELEPGGVAPSGKLEQHLAAGERANLVEFLESLYFPGFEALVMREPDPGEPPSP